MNGKRLTTRIGLIGLFALAGLGIAILMAIAPAGAHTTGDVYPGTGDWEIQTNTRVIDEEIIVSGNITIDADLELWNATIKISLPSDNAYKVKVTENGNLMANDSMITSTITSYEYGFRVLGPMNLNGRKSWVGC